MKALLNVTLIFITLLAGTVANATEFNVRIINLTNGIWYTPFLVAAHPAGTSLFTSGQPASASLQAGVAPLSWTVYRLCDHEMFQHPFCIKSYTQDESSSLGVVISTSG
jgi:hypothetical protein